MEPITSASAIIALGSQVLSGAREIQNFISKIKNARSDVENTAEELVTLARVLDGVESFGESHVPALCNCMNKLQSLHEEVESLEFHNTTKNPLKHLGMILRYSRRSNAWKRLEELLAQAKLTLLIAMAQRTISVGENLQSSTLFDRQLLERNDRAMSSHVEQIQALIAHQDRSQQAFVEATARQDATHQAEILARLDSLDARLECNFTSTTPEYIKMTDGHWEKLFLEMKRVTGKIQDDPLRTNVQQIIYRSIKRHAATIINEQGSCLDSGFASDSDPCNGVSPMPRLRMPKRSQNYLFFRRHFFGVIFIATSICRASNDSTNSAGYTCPFSTQSRFVFHPSRLTILRGLQTRIEIRLMRKASQGWEHSIRFFNAVPPDAPIFRVCIKGDISAVQSLFSSGEASPWDVDENGWSPLHYAAQHCHSELCRLLLENNSDAHALTYPQVCSAVFIPFDLAWIGTVYEASEPSDSSGWLNTIRCFADTAGDSRMLSPAGIDLESLLSVVNYTQVAQSASSKAFVQLLQWVLQNCLRDEMQEPERRQSAMRGVYYAANEAVRLVDMDHGAKILKQLLSAANLNINTSTTTEGQMMMIHFALSGGLVIRPEGLQMLLSASADPHLKSEEKVPCNPTQVALQHADTFRHWRHAIKEFGYEITHFVEKSFQQPNWTDSDWTKDALLLMFDTNFGSVFIWPYYNNTMPCWMCGRGWSKARCQWWDMVTRHRKVSSDQPITDYDTFVDIARTSESSILDMGRMLLTDSRSEVPSFSDYELLICKSIWRYLPELRNTCTVCLARTRYVAQKLLLEDLNPLDILAGIKKVIKPDIDGTYNLKGRWELFKERLESNFSSSGSRSGD